MKALPASRYTYYTRSDAWVTSGARGWTSGSFPGELWFEYQRTGGASWRTRALRSQAALGRCTLDRRSTDLSARYFSSFVRGYTLTGLTRLKAPALKAARLKAARFDPVAGIMRSRDTKENVNVIIDSLTSVQLLFWGARHGGPREWRAIALQDALTTARDFVRPDGSVYHVVIYDEDTGQVLEKTGGQGYSAESTWSRGQAWAIYGFTTTYRETRDPTLLATARMVADRYLADVPADMVPYWDFDAPDVPAAPRDSAAAIAASGLADLARCDPDPVRRARYAEAARATLASLASPAYFSNGTNSAVLQHGTMSYRGGSVDCGQSFGDYFFLEALLRLRRLPPTTPELLIHTASASSGDPSRAVDGLPGTHWSARGKQWLQLYLGRPVIVSSVGLTIYHGRSSSARLSILTSTDRKHWSLATRSLSSGETNGQELYGFRPRRARWIRVLCSGTSRGPVTGITEALVF